MALSTMWRGARRGLVGAAVQQQGARAASTFANVPLGPPDPIFGLTDAFNKVRAWSRGRVVAGCSSGLM